MTPGGDNQPSGNLVVGVLLVIPYAASVRALLKSNKGGEYGATIRNCFRQFGDHFGEIMPMTIVIYFAHMVLCFFGL
jgi:hypothetical protein